MLRVEVLGGGGIIRVYVRAAAVFGGCGKAEGGSDFNAVKRR